MGYPTTQNLKDFLEGSRLIEDTSASPYDLLDYAGAVAGAEEFFENSVKWFPFLSSGSASTRLFDPPINNGRDYPYLSLQGGLTALTSVSISGTTLDTSQYFSCPTNTLAKGRPITGIEFYRVYYVASLPRSVSVIGKWGYCDTLPDSVFNAVLHYAASTLLASVSFGVSQGLAGKKEGDEEWRYGNDDFKMGADMWAKEFQEVVRRYQRCS